MQFHEPTSFNEYEWRSIFRKSRWALWVLITATAITVVVFLPYSRLLRVEDGMTTIVRANGEIYHRAIQYALEINAIQGPHYLWSLGMIPWYIALFLSPCVVFVYAVFSTFRQLRLWQQSQTLNIISKQNIVGGQVVKVICVWRLWLSVLFGLIPSLTLMGIPLSGGIILDIQPGSVLKVYDFELFRMLLLLGVFLFVWWSSNLLAIVLGTFLVFALKEPVTTAFLSFLGVSFLIIGNCSSTVVVFAATSPNPISGSGANIAEISIVPLIIYLIAPLFLSGLLLGLSKMLRVAELPQFNTK